MQEMIPGLPDLVQPEQLEDHDDDDNRADDVQNRIHDLFPPQWLQL
jgi:hypothetical protein